MKKLKVAASLSVLGLVVSGCMTTPNSQFANVPRFHDGSEANAVLQFSSWDYTFLVKPKYDDDGFLLPVRRDNINRVFGRLNVHHNLAVVVIGWTYQAKTLDDIVAQWKTILAGCGFRRAVFLRANAYDRLNGSLIIDDSSLSSLASAQNTAPEPAAAQPGALATVASAAGANAANSPGHSIRPVSQRLDVGAATGSQP